MTDNTPEDVDRGATEVAPPKRLYVKPFIRVLDMEDSAGKNLHPNTRATSTTSTS
jgi:hypothetical protein